MSTKDDLIAARALIDTPEKWRKAPVDDGTGTPCCMVVAVGRIHLWGTPGNEAMRDALREAVPNTYKGYRTQDGIALGMLNDDPRTTHADVMALFDRAIGSQP